MKTATTLMTHAAPVPRSHGFFKRVLYWILDLDDPATLEEGIRRMRSARGLYASLSPETLEYLRTYDGPENHGPPLTRRERREWAQRRAQA